MVELAEEFYKYNPWWEQEYHTDFIKRPRYNEFLRKNTRNKDIIIITGLRRVGKTSLMKLHISDLLKDVDPKQIFYASLDSITLEKIAINEIIREYRKIHQLKLKDKVYLFFDEVGCRSTIHQALKNLYDAENVKIFATSSSSAILRDTSAMLTGRSRIFEILPLSFQEYLVFRNLKPLKSEAYLIEQYFEDYMQQGGMPEYVLTGDRSYLDNLVDSVIYKDIIAYYNIRDITTIRDFFRLLMERAGKQFSINKVAKILGLSPDTVKRYLDYFAGTYLVYTMERCGKLNERLRSPKKLFVADTGIRNLATGYRDKGAIFENLVFMKIKHLNPCYVYQNRTELDFLLGDTLIEVKYGRQLNSNQETAFNNHPAKKKLLIETVSDYLALG